MRRKKTPPSTPTEEEILSYDNVPIPVAARYIGMTEQSLRLALREERARHLGFAVEGNNHSPGGLIRYKKEGGSIIPFEHVQEVLTKVVVEEVRRRLPAAQ